MQISAVPREQVPFVWPDIEPVAEKGLRQIRADDLTLEEVRERLLDGRYLMWVAHEEQEVVGTIVMSIIERARGKVLFVVLVAGTRFMEWAPQTQVLLKDFADMVGAKKMESHSRVGMEKWMKQLGWRKRAVIMEWSNG